MLFLFSISNINNLHAQQIPCPQNLDFEQGTFANWLFFTGNCCPVVTPTYSGAIFGRHTLMFGQAFDRYGGFPTVAPGGGMYSLKLGNDSARWQAERARYYVQVPQGQNSYALVYRYAVVFQDPGHVPADQPKFEVNVYDSATGKKIDCNNHLYVASSNLPGFKQSTVDQTVYYRDWTTATIDFNGLGGHTLAIDFTTADCGQGGHFGYGYLDLSCGMYEVYNINCKPDPSITLNAPPGFQQYIWMDTAFGLVYGYNESMTIPTPTKTIKFAVILKPYAGFGCDDTLYTTVKLSELITQTSSDTIICEGSTAKLVVKSNSLGTPLTYQWTPGNTLSCSLCDSAIAWPKTTTKYYVSVSDTAGCLKRDSVLVTVRDSVNPSIVSNLDSLCEYEFVEITNTAQNPATAGYFWDLGETGEILSGFGTQKITADWVQPGKKRVILKITNEGCIERDTIDIYVKDKPDAVITAPTDACLGDTVVMTTNPENATYYWHVDDYDIQDRRYKDEYRIGWTTVGKKKMELFLYSDDGCYDSTTHEIAIHEVPEAKIESDDNDLCSGKKFDLATKEGSRYSYSWTPPQYFLENDRPEVSGIAERTGYVYLTVINQWQCTAQDSFFIYAGPCCEVFMPDAFTPNGDGRNDTYHPVDMRRNVMVYFMIVNRWGEVLYESNIDDGRGWDGMYDGKPAPTGTYNYLLRYLCDNSEEFSKKGNFILIR
ncbi:MAG: gliding motility-associated C-terminal domain-containing protein [Chitinophagales bacterium]|nr:gliding motility-associated C-terminal domain-containing protein [Chitinophagaceae bacterium]MCB9064351.1 gliding motility-associated C-terminal domain-containing protein [Chitinophagales bacterium]